MVMLERRDEIKALEEENGDLEIRVFFLFFGLLEWKSGVFNILCSVLVWLGRSWI